MRRIQVALRVSCKMPAQIRHDDPNVESLCSRSPLHFVGTPERRDEVLIPGVVDISQHRGTPRGQACFFCFVEREVEQPDTSFLPNGIVVQTDVVVVKTSEKRPALGLQAEVGCGTQSGRPDSFFYSPPRRLLFSIPCPSKVHVTTAMFTWMALMIMHDLFGPTENDITNLGRIGRSGPRTSARFSRHPCV